jgi:UDP-glucose 6-dehydrogenase
VPGPDGNFGYGGHCFPKDINALIFLAKSLNITPIMMQAAWDKNNEVRKERDWEKMQGRAVSKRNADSK